MKSSKTKMFFTFSYYLLFFIDCNIFVNSSQLNACSASHKDNDGFGCTSTIIPSTFMLKRYFITDSIKSVRPSE